MLDPSGNEILTLVTCYPFYFVGPLPIDLSFANEQKLIKAITEIIFN